MNPEIALREKRILNWGLAAVGVLLLWATANAACFKM